MDDLVAVGSRQYFFFLMLLLVSRGADFLSTWIATPNMVLEGNPLAKMLGWKWGSFINLVLCGVFAAWPLAAIVVGTTSVLVAARNFQSVWLMRSLGEEGYRCWYAERVRDGSMALLVFCLIAQAVLVGSIGAALMIFSESAGQVALVPFGIGTGVVTYAVAVLFYSLLSLWRLRRALR